MYCSGGWLRLILGTFDKSPSVGVLCVVERQTTWSVSMTEVKPVYVSLKDIREWKTPCL